MASNTLRNAPNAGQSEFGEVYLGLMTDAPESNPNAGDESPLFIIFPSEISVPETKVNINKIGTLDRSHNVSLFHGTIDTTNTDIVITFPCALDNNWLRAKSYNEADSRNDMRRWTLTVFNLDEQARNRTRGLRFYDGVLVTFTPEMKMKYDSHEVQVEQYTFKFERVQELTNVDPTLEGVAFADVTNNFGFTADGENPLKAGITLDPNARMYQAINTVE